MSKAGDHAGWRSGIRPGETFGAARSKERRATSGRHALFNRGKLMRISAADYVLAFHFLFATFAVFGGFLVLLDWRVAFVHIPAVIWSSVVNLADWTCPLTPLEQTLRRQAGQQAFEGSWTQKYIEPLVRPFGMPRRMELIAGISAVAWNVMVYGYVIWSGKTT